MVFKHRAALAYLVIAGAAAGVWGSGLSTASGSPKHSRVGSAQAAQISPELKAHFALFRRAHRIGFGAILSAAPRGVQRILRTDESAASSDPFRASLALAVQETRVVRSGSHRVWVVPGANGACITTWTVGAVTGSGPRVLGIGYTTCDSTASILRRGLVSVGGQPDGRELFFGLVPDGTTVVLRSPTGTHQKVPVVNNVILAAVKPDSMTLTLRESDGATVSFPSEL